MSVMSTGASDAEKSGGPGKRLLSYADLAEIGIPFSRVHVNRLEAAGLFPKRVHIAANTVRWVATEVEQYITARIAARGKQAA